MAQDPLQLFKEFTFAVSSAQYFLQSEYLVPVQVLCEKAPAFAQFLTKEIPKYLKEGGETGDENPKVQESGTTPVRSRKWRKPSDPSYRPPKSAKPRERLDDNAVEISGEIEARDVRVKESFAANKSPLLSVKDGGTGQEARDQPLAQHDTMAINDVSKSIARSPQSEPEKPPFDSIVCHPLTPRLHESKQKAATATKPILTGNKGSPQVQARNLDKPQEHEQTVTVRTVLLAPEKREQKPPILASFTQVHGGNVEAEALPGEHPADGKSPEADKVERTSAPTSQDVVPSTPKAQVDQDGWPSPPTEEVPRAALSPLRAMSVPDSPLPNPQALTLQDLVVEALTIIDKMSSPQLAVPTGTHSAVLRTLQASLHGTSNNAIEFQRPGSIWTAADPREWSATMWIRLLEAGESRSKTTTILNMIEWMGASVWYDAQLEQLAKAPPLTKRGKPRKRVATVFLDNLLDGKEPDNASGPVIKRRRLALKNAEGSPSAEHFGSIQEKATDQRRTTIINLARRGRKLRTMVLKTGLGILLLEKIWAYEKMKVDEFDVKVADEFRRDPQKMKLLSIFEDQIKLLVDKGRPSLSRFLDLLESEGMALSSEVSALRIKFGLEADAVPTAFVDAQVDRISEGVRQLLDKPGFEDDSIMVGDAVELPFDSLNRLRPGRWLDMWIIAAAMELADKPSCVRYGLSVPLDEDDRVIPITKPFGLWRRKIDEYRREVENDARLIYFCPLNLNTNHFTLLEINEQLRTIYHYDSMAGGDVIRGKARRTRMRDIVEAEFKDLGFTYKEAPCPQQNDGSSCGLMVIRNAILRMNGQEVGNWDDKVDPEQVCKEVADILEAGLQNNTVQPKAALRRSKRKLADQS